MKLISKSNNLNNSRATVQFQETNLLDVADSIAKKNGCGFSHNVTTRPFTIDGAVFFRQGFGTISFNKGNHAVALMEFLEASGNII